MDCCFPDRMRTMTLFAALLALAAAAAPPGNAAGTGLPTSWALVSTGTNGGVVYQGQIPNQFLPSDHRPSAIYLPPGYNPARRYPVVYLLHGMAGRPTSIWGGLHLADIADGLVSSGQTKPFIAVMPVAAPTVNPNSGEWAGVWENYVVHNVVPWIDAHLPTQPGPKSAPSRASAPAATAPAATAPSTSASATPACSGRSAPGRATSPPSSTTAPSSTPAPPPPGHTTRRCSSGKTPPAPAPRRRPLLHLGRRQPRQGAPPVDDRLRPRAHRLAAAARALAPAPDRPRSLLGRDAPIRPPLRGQSIQERVTSSRTLALQAPGAAERAPRLEPASRVTCG